MNHNQTNGIPTGSILMDFIAEMLLGYVDLELSKKLKDLSKKLKMEDDYQIFRYRDDYRIFSNNLLQIEEITKELSELLSGMGLRLGPSKTKSSDNIIKNSIKEDKRYWIVNGRKTVDEQKWLIHLYLMSENFPNSGTLHTQMNNFLTHIYKKNSEQNKSTNIETKTLVSLIVEIVFRNPRVGSTSVLILAFLLKQIADKKEKKEIIDQIKNKFDQKSNSSFLRIWLQRLYLKNYDSIKYDEPICKKVYAEYKKITVPCKSCLLKTKIWELGTLDKKIKKIFCDTPIISYKSLENLDEVPNKEEVKALTFKRPY
ncbi:MAG: RNA-directed DNA polymerase [Flavobacteriales bacterium]